MKEEMKPLPKIDGDSKKFWEGCKNGQLLIQQCKDCNMFIYYPRIVCPSCMSSHLIDVESTGKGTIYSYTIAYRGAGLAYKNDVPYIVALIELEEGVRMLSNVIDCAPEDVHIKMKVQVSFEERDDYSIPQFIPH